jgi:hypothetical protein
MKTLSWNPYSSCPNRSQNTSEECNDLKHPISNLTNGLEEAISLLFQEAALSSPAMFLHLSPWSKYDPLLWLRIVLAGSYQWVLVTERFPTMDNTGALPGANPLC